MLRGLPFRSCLFIVSIAFLTNSSSLNSTTLLNQGQLISPRKLEINLRIFMFENAFQFLTHNPNQGYHGSPGGTHIQIRGSRQDTVKIKKKHLNILNLMYLHASSIFL